MATVWKSPGLQAGVASVFAGSLDECCQLWACIRLLKHNAPHAVIKQAMKGVWDKGFKKVHADMHTHVSKSAKSHHQRGDAAQSEEHANTTTFGLLVILLSWGQWRRDKAAKLLCARVLHVLLAATTKSCPSSFSTSLQQRLLCDAELDDDNVCMHLREVLALRQLAGQERADRWVRFLGACFEAECPAVLSLLTATLALLAAEIDGARDDWTASPHLQPPTLTGPKGRKRTLDAGTKHAVLREKAVAGDTRYWIRRHLVAMVEAAAQQAKMETFFSLAFDGGRVRKPPADVNLCVCYFHGCESTIVLPPVVHT